MKLQLDEHYSTAVAAALRARGHDVIAVQERADLVGMTDRALLEQATGEGRALVTNNVSDFVALAREWAAEGDSHAGLVFTSDRSLPRSRAGAGRLVKALEQLLVTHPRADALRDQAHWLRPPAE